MWYAIVVWIVEMETMRSERELETLIESGALSEQDQFIISAWTRQVMFHGPESLRIDPKWADHEPYDNWRGYRSSSFSVSGRIIYRIEGKTIKVKIARVTNDHNYKKEKGK
jgi:mRNA-degrading endonuclease YafQ of YafQ-DinJ toxin-antitoxin module